MLDPDANYSFNPWMRQQPRPGDNVDPGIFLDQEGVLAELVTPSEVARTIRPKVGNIPFPPRTGYEQRQPTILDALTISQQTLMQDTETRQESGHPGSGGPSLGAW